MATSNIFFHAFGSKIKRENESYVIFKDTISIRLSHPTFISIDQFDLQLSLTTSFDLLLISFSQFSSKFPNAILLPLPVLYIALLPIVIFVIELRLFVTSHLEDFHEHSVPPDSLQSHF